MQSLNQKTSLPRNAAAAKRDKMVMRSLSVLSIAFLLIAIAEFALNVEPIRYIHTLIFSTIIMSGSIAIRLGADRNKVVIGLLVCSLIEFAFGLFTIGGLSNRYSLLVVLLPIIAMFSQNPRTIITTGALTIGLIGGLYAVNDQFFAHLADREQPIALQAAITALTVAAVSLILAGISSDARHTAEHDTAQVRHDLEAAKYASLAKMAGCVAHEIANPLAILKGHVEVLMVSIQAGRSDNIEARLASIDRTSGRLERLIKILASMGDPDRGYGPSPIAFSGIVSDALALLAATSETTGVTVDQQLASSPEKSWMTGNRSLITTILFELTHASILVAKDSADKKISLSTERTDGYITVNITTGHQKSAEEIDRITRTLNISLMQLLTASMGGRLTISRDDHTYVQELVLQVAGAGPDKERFGKGS
jgi:signal transduction histidine kinase